MNRMKKALLPLLLVVALLVATVPAFAVESPEVVALASVKAASANYNGSKQVPVLTVKDANGNTVPEGNYTFKLNKTAKNAGSYKVTVTGIGNYTGTVKGTFKINKIKNPFNIRCKNTLFRYSKKRDRKSTIYVYGLKERSQTKITWKTSNKKIKVSNGKLIVKKGFKGSATVTASSKATKNYKATKKSIKIKVW